jgi:hypothetical protein
MFVTNFYEFSVSDSEGPPAQGDMLAWYRGDSLQGTTTATGWNDKSASGFNLTATGSPAIADNAYGSRTALTLVNTSTQYFSRAISIAAETYPEFTVVIVYKNNTFIEGFMECPVVSTLAEGGAEQNFMNYLGKSSSIYNVGTQSWDNNIMEAANGSVGEWHYSEMGNAENSYLRVDGAEVDTVGGVGAGGFWGDNLRICGNEFYSTAQPGRFHGQIAEIIIYNKLLNGTERSELASYIAAYYS